MRYLVFLLATLTCTLVLWVVTGGRRAAADGNLHAGAGPGGSVVYKESCAQCHGERLEGGGGRGLAGPTFLARSGARGASMS